MAEFNTTTYDVQRSTGVCALTGRTLEPGEKYFATLVELDPEESQEGQGNALGFKRIDVSLEAWEQGSRPDNLFSFWKAAVALPNEKKKLLVDDAVLMGLLKKLEGSEKSARLAFRYVLGLILMRKKLLRYDSIENKPATIDGQLVEGSWWLFTPKLDIAKGRMGKWDENNFIEVLDPHLDNSKIEEVISQLGEILEAEL